jgi:hypothetical protein
VTRVAGDLLKLFLRDCDRWGTEFTQYARRVVSEVLSVGRGGSLVLQSSESSRPCVSFWRAEDVLNWSVERIGQEVVLTEVVLREAGGLLVFGLERTNGADGGCTCVMEVWRPGQGGDGALARPHLYVQAHRLHFLPSTWVTVFAATSCRRRSQTGVLPPPTDPRPELGRGWRCCSERWRLFPGA